MDENNEIKILIDALKYTSNIIVDLTNKLEIQEEKIKNQENKIDIIENKLNKFQKLSMENSLKLKTINIDKINNLCEIYNNKHNNLNNSEEMSEYVIDKTTSKQNTKSNIKSNIKSNDNYQQDTNVKNKIDKLIGSIVKRKDILDKMLVENNVGDINNQNNSNQEEKSKYVELDYTIKTATNKSNIDKNSKTNLTNGTQSRIDDINEQEKITNAQNNDLNKANNILKQIRRRSNFIKKM